MIPPDSLRPAMEGSSAFSFLNLLSFPQKELAIDSLCIRDILPLCLSVRYSTSPLIGPYPASLNLGLCSEDSEFPTGTSLAAAQMDRDQFRAAAHAAIDESVWSALYSSIPC
jgi:hypothetical protein